MAKGFSIMDLMNEMSRDGAAAETEIIEKVSVFDIQPNENNFYRISSIEQLKNSIYAMGGVQQNLLLAKLPPDSGFKYKILAGHRRARACMELVHEGHKQFEHVPAVIRKDIDKDTEDTLLVMTNSTQRELSDWEKVMQHMKLKEIIPKLKKRQGLDGKTRTLEADYLGVSEGQIAVYNTIGTKLDAWLMGVFKDGGIGISLAYEAAKLEPELQGKLRDITLSKGSFTEGDIKKLISSRPINGQQKIADLEKVAESATSGNTPAAAIENVTESVTSGKTADEPVHIPAAAIEDVTESDTFEECPAAAIEKVTESDTFEEYPAAVKGAVKDNRIKLRGGYEPVLIDDLIHQYDTYRGMLSREDRQNRKQICKYDCLLDALELLKDRIAQEECETYDENNS